ncbi:MAG: enoyl-ACP reductase FabI [Chloroflexi bacterium]|nr:MAG: enoyl-ACP reductase FabI [Chloroflexota bacterium]TME44399.1 MAG: enoyl-ACP reductase FabI [Chloroflexota bacterium]
MPGILEGKKILVTGVLTPASIAFAIAETAQKEGADIVLTSFGRVMSLTEKSARRMKPTPEILEMDVNKQEQIDALADSLRQRWGRLDGFVHAIAFAPADSLGGHFLTAPWESVQNAFQTSAYSLKAMAQSLSPLMAENGGGSIVTLDFDNSTQAWPFYDWMGVCKAALESVTRYLARDLGHHHIRVNALAAGPLKTMAAKGIPGFENFENSWGKRSPLGWDSQDRGPVAKMACVLLSDWSSMTTGEIVHVDGGYHAMGAEVSTEPVD